jgi:hypothetical protein
MISLPWESEHIVESSKCQFNNGSGAPSAGVVALVSNVNNPIEYALIVVDDDEEIARQQSSSQSGFLGKIKSIANSAASQATRMQRQVTAGCNKLAAVYGVKLVVAVCCNVEFRISGSTLIASWQSVESPNLTVRLEDLSNRFLNMFNTSREIALTKNRTNFLPNGPVRTFSWLWKYQPVVPLPTGQEFAAKSVAPTKGGRMVCLSWNVAGLAPPQDNPDNVVASMFSKYKKSLIKFFNGDYDVVVIALQEASPLNAKTVLFKGSDTNYGEAWLDWFTDVLSNCVSPKGSFEYVRTAAIVQVGLAVAMFVRNDDRVKTTAPMTSCVKTGTLGLTGNKGCVGVRSSVGLRDASTDFTVSVLNVHLASGDGKGDFRKNELSKIINESSFGDEKNFHFFDSDLAIITGDLNSRIAEGFETDGDDIPSEDELLTRMREEGAGFMFHENPIEFPATYKLVPGEEGRLVFADNRKPGWCDRVLYRSTFVGHQETGLGGIRKEESKKFVCTQYNSLRDIDLSDHTPVYAIFEIAESNDRESEGDDNSTIPGQRATATAPSVEFNIGEDESSDNDSDLYDK